MSERWQQYFIEKGLDSDSWLRVAVEHWNFSELVYGNIRNHESPPARILEVGCGPGFSCMYLSSCGYSVTGIDNDLSIVEMANNFCNRFEMPAKFEQGDAFNLEPYHHKFDLAFSVGVLEHFDREVTVQLLQEQARCASKVLIIIPSKYTALSDGITDERIYSIAELKSIVRDAGLNVIASFGYGDVTVSAFQIGLRRVLPRAVYRWMQNRGYSFSIAVMGECRKKNESS